MIPEAGSVVPVSMEDIRSRLEKGKRIRSRSMAPMRQKGGRRVRLHAQRMILNEYIRRHCQQFPTVDRLVCKMTGKELPGEPCNCDKCWGKPQSWPVGYRRQGKSYECWLHSQSNWFLHNLPSSSSIVRYG